MARFCSNCGTALTEDSVFCSNCGARVEEPQANHEDYSEFREEPPHANIEGAPNESYSYAESAPAPKKNNKKTIIIAAVAAVVAIIAIILVMSFGGSASPEAAAKKFMDGLVNNDPDEIIDSFPPFLWLDSRTAKKEFEASFKDAFDLGVDRITYEITGTEDLSNSEERYYLGQIADFMEEYYDTDYYEEDISDLKLVKVEATLYLYNEEMETDLDVLAIKYKGRWTCIPLYILAVL